MMTEMIKDLEGMSVDQVMENCRVRMEGVKAGLVEAHAKQLKLEGVPGELISVKIDLYAAQLTREIAAASEVLRARLEKIGRPLN